MLFTIEMKEVKRESILGSKLGKTLAVYQIEAKHWIDAAREADQRYINEHPENEAKVFSYVV